MSQCLISTFAKRRIDRFLYSLSLFISLWKPKKIKKKLHHETIKGTDQEKRRRRNARKTLHCNRSQHLSFILICVTLLLKLRLPDLVPFFTCASNTIHSAALQYISRHQWTHHRRIPVSYYGNHIWIVMRLVTSVQLQ